MSIVSRPWYAVWDAQGNEKGDVRWLRVGLRRWYVEVGKWGLIVHLRGLHFEFHLNHPDE